jgi:hypothetical protein
MLLDVVEDHEVPKAALFVEVGDGGEGHLEEGLVGAFDALANEAELFGGSLQVAEGGAPPVDADESAQLVQGGRGPVVQQDGRQCGGGAIARVRLPPQFVVPQQQGEPPSCFRG